jgi:hypothetical protein
MENRVVETGVVHKVISVGAKGSVCVMEPSHNSRAEQEIMEASVEKVSRNGKV